MAWSPVEWTDCASGSIPVLRFVLTLSKLVPSFRVTVELSLSRSIQCFAATAILVCTSSWADRPACRLGPDGQALGGGGKGGREGGKEAGREAGEEEKRRKCVCGNSTGWCGVVTQRGGATEKLYSTAGRGNLLLFLARFFFAKSLSNDKIPLGADFQVRTKVQVLSTLSQTCSRLPSLCSVFICKFSQT